MPSINYSKELTTYIRDIPDFPKKGILFYDITPLLGNAESFKMAIDALAAQIKGEKVDYVVAIESRGFIFGTALAYKLGAGFVPVRKKGKLPYKTRSVSYELEYGTDTLEIHDDAIPAGSRVVVLDDLLATGGTMSAVVSLVNGFKVKLVGVLFLVELTFLNGRDKLKDMPVSSIIRF